MTSLNLHPDALADLRKSGLSDEAIVAAGLYTPSPDDLSRLLGPRLASKVQHALIFPYPGAEPFYRAKLFPPIADGEGHTMRYYQPAGTAPRLYLPARIRAALTDPSLALYITEGEKKTLRADQDGLGCIGLGGLWNWRYDGRPLADLDRIDWYARETILVPDSDVWTRADLLQPVYALGRELEMRGATVSVLKLPCASDGAKVGLDDYLCLPSAAPLAALPRLALKHRLFTRTAAWWKEWTKRKEAAADGREATILELLRRGGTGRMLHPAQDVLDGELWYGLSTDLNREGTRALILVTSGRKAYLADRLPESIVLRHGEPGPSTVTGEVATRWLSGAETGSVARTIDGLADFFLRYVVLRDRPTALWVAAWALATWCYRAFRVFPYLSIRSAEKRCGKSRMLGLLQRVGFNASPVTTHPTEAQLYRAAARTGGVQLFDEVETLKGDKDRFDTLITVLNVGFERGGVVTRLEKRGERFVEERYEVYAPRVLAGIAGLKDTLEDRAVPLVMLRRRKTETVARIGRATDIEAQGLRDQCALAALTRIDDILAAYELALTTLEREGIDDRAVELWSPLLAMAFVADAEDTADRSRDMLASAKELATLREADADAGPTPRLLEALLAIRRERGETIIPADLLAGLRARPGWDWVKTTRRLAGMLNPLGIARRQVWDRERRRWAYVLDPDHLADLQARYGTDESGLEMAATAVSAASASSPSETGPIR